MFRCYAFAALIVLARLAAAADLPIPDFVPPGTNTLMGFDLRAVIDSGLVQRLGSDLFKSAGARWSSSSAVPGIDPLKDLDGFVIASAVEGGDHPPTLVICHGRIPMNETGDSVERYHGIPIRRTADGNAMAVLDAATMLAGDLKEVRAAIDRREAHTAGLNPALAKRAAEMSARYAIWGVGNLAHGFHPSTGKLEGLGSLDHFDFGIALKQGMELAATFHVRAPDDAQKLAAFVQFIQMMAKAQPDSSGTRIRSHVENGTLSFSLVLSEAALKKAIDQQRAGLAQAFAQGMAHSAAPQASALPSWLPSLSPATPQPPASKETKIISDDQGNTMQVTLPGRR